MKLKETLRYESPSAAVIRPALLALMQSFLPFAQVERLENTILRLQMENNKLQEHLTEMKLKHNHKIMNAMKEVSQISQTAPTLH